MSKKNPYSATMIGRIWGALLKTRSAGLLEKIEETAHAMLSDDLPSHRVTERDIVNVGTAPCPQRELTARAYSPLFDGVEFAHSARMTAIADAVDVLRDCGEDVIPKEGLPAYSQVFLNTLWLIVVYHTVYPQCVAQISPNGAVQLMVAKEDLVDGYLDIAPATQAFKTKMRAALKEGA